jgi:hypothetical protein
MGVVVMVMMGIIRFESVSRLNIIHFH